ncbi:MAG: type II secretion system minor pseudopilin GspJ [Gammaproteobacteria bacterium]|nr:type II secretion system minor pseudopilin GspJ [Gammaproteobacteria bacterium]
MMHRKAAGFTLLEILIAVTITAVIATSAFAILNQALGTQTNAEQNDRRLAELQRAMNRISMDLQMLADRAVRNEYGDLLPQLMGDKSSDESFISFTRQGKRNPANLPRTEMERVTYRLSEGSLVREQWLVLDIASTDQIVERELLKDVTRFEVEFFHEEQWLDSWPTTDASNIERDQLSSLKPKAIKLIIELKELGELIQIYPLEGAG